MLKNLFHKIDWKSDGFSVIGKDFDQIVWYCDYLQRTEKINYEKYVPILHTMGKIWAIASRSKNGD